MSLPRVSSIETFTTVPDLHPRSRRESDASTRARKLTFNPLPEIWDPPLMGEQLQAVGAFTVPRWKRLLQVTAAVLACFFASGIVFGFAAIKPVLKAEGAYRHLCSVPDGLNDEEDTCVEMHLNLMFTVAAVATNVAALPVGAILDHFGPRVCGLLGSLFLAAGALLMAFENRMPFDALLLGYLLLALGGPFTYISSFQLSNAFPRNSGFILALLTGAFDASSALFLIYRIIYQSTSGALTQQRFFLLYLTIPLLIIFLQFTLMPSHSYKTVGELVQEVEDPLPTSTATPSRSDPTPYDQVTEETALLREEQFQQRADDVLSVLGTTNPDKQTRREEAVNRASGVWGVMHGRRAREQLCSAWFVLICLFTVVQMTRINFFVATVRAQYEHLLGSHGRAVAVNDFFDVALPVGGVLAVPMIGFVLDGVSTPVVLAGLVGCATVIGGLGMVSGMEWAAYANVVLFVVYRPFYYTAVSDYTAKVFGFETFGTVYGAIICLAGVLNFSQSGLDYMFEKTFEGNPVPVNALLLGLGLAIGIVLVVFVSWKAKRVKREVLEVEARGAFGGIYA